MSLKLQIKNFLNKGEAYHFARIEIGAIQKEHLHSHDFSELFWVESGHGLHWIHGKERQLNPATLMFIRPNDLHNVGAATAEDKLVICNLAFPTSAWRLLARRHKTPFIAWFCPTNPEACEHMLSSQAFDFLHRTGLEMILSHRTGLMLERFFLNLAVALDGRQKPLSSRAPLWLSEALRRVEQEGLYREGPSALTRISARSQEHVEREAKRWLRKTPTALINEIRMRYAADSLSTTQKEIVDVCYECGLENVGHFYALFKKHYGITPRQYRLATQSIVRPVQVNR